MLLCGTFSSAEFMSIVLTVTWLSVHTPTTCTMCKVKTNTVYIIIQYYLEVNLPTHLGADGLEVRELLTEVPPLASLQLRQSVEISVMVVFKILTHLLSMKIRMVNLPTNF